MSPSEVLLDQPDCWLKFSAILPDFHALQARMALDSAGAVESLGLERAAYGNDPRQWVELAKAPGKAQLVPVMIHGGYWRALRAEDHRFVLTALAQMGYGVANVEYRLMPGARMDDLVQDTVAGLRRIAASFPAARLVPVGHSAGAHLALAALHRDGELRAGTAGVVAISGTYDLSLVARSFLQDELALTGDEVARFSITSLPDVPTLLITGSAETEPFQTQAGALATTRRNARRIRVTPCHHMNILHACFSAGAPLVPVLHDWLSDRPIPQTIEVSAP